jgi:hypothetical protein
MIWFNKKENPVFIDSPYIEIKAFPCDKVDCKNYNNYRIIQRGNSQIGILWSRDMNFLTCLCCIYFKKSNCYITGSDKWQDSVKNT